MKKIGMWLAIVLAIVTVTAVFTLSGCTAADPEVIVETVTETVIETVTVTETVEVGSDTTPIKIGHGTFWTGEAAFVGPPFAAITDFTLGIVNQDPPLGQAVTVLHSDEGTIGEQQWVQRDIDVNNYRLC